MTFAPPRFLSSALLLSVAAAGTLRADAGPSGDPVHGRFLFQQNCSLCHASALGPRNQPVSGQGPSLVNVVGRRAASAANFNYSAPLTASGLVWDRDTLVRFLAAPTALVPGTVMPMAIADVGDRVDIVAYLATLDDPEVSSGTQASVDASQSEDTGDWHHDAPGNLHRVVVAALPAPFSTSSAGNGPKVVARPEGAQLSVPKGFKVELFARGLSGPRLTRVAPNGDIFVAETNSGKVVVLRAAAGATKPETTSLFASGLQGPFGIAFYPQDGSPQWVYVATLNSVVRFPYQSGDLKARGMPETVVPELAPRASGGHTTRDVAFSPDGKRMYVSVGSSSNVAEGMSTKAPEERAAWEASQAFGSSWDGETHRANILVTDPTGHAPLRVYATGIRNPVGLAIHPRTGALWTSTNERDGLGDDLVPDYVTSVREGGFYGWPWYYMGNHEDPRHARERPELAGKVLIPDVPFQAHSATLQIAFYTAISGSSVFPAAYRGDLFVACHGSWNRNSRTGYKVARVRFRDGVPTGAYEDFLTGFVVDQASVWGRPVGVAVAQDGALLVTEDGNGTIWRVSTVPGE